MKQQRVLMFMVVSAMLTLFAIVVGISMLVAACTAAPTPVPAKETQLTQVAVVVKETVVIERQVIVTTTPAPATATFTPTTSSTPNNIPTKTLTSVTSTPIFTPTIIPTPKKCPRFSVKSNRIASPSNNTLDIQPGGYALRVGIVGYPWFLVWPPSERSFTSAAFTQNGIQVSLDDGGVYRLNEYGYCVEVIK